MTRAHWPRHDDTDRLGKCRRLSAPLTMCHATTRRVLGVLLPPSSLFQQWLTNVTTSFSMAANVSNQGPSLSFTSRVKNEERPARHTIARDSQHHRPSLQQKSVPNLTWPTLCAECITELQAPSSSVRTSDESFTRWANISVGDKYGSHVQNRRASMRRDCGSRKRQLLHTLKR